MDIDEAWRKEDSKLVGEKFALFFHKIVDPRE